MDSLSCRGMAMVMGSTVGSTVGFHGGSDDNMGPGTRAVAYCWLKARLTVRHGSMMVNLNITFERKSSSGKESEDVRLHCLDI